MSFIIGDGSGKSFNARVDSKNRLFVKAILEPEDMEINEEEGAVWSAPFETITMSGTNGYFFYFKNTSSAVRYHITDIRISAGDAATQIEVQRVTGTASAGTDIAEVTRNTNSNKVINGTLQTATGAGFTGLTNSGVIFFIQCAVTGTEYHLRTSSNIIIQPGTAIALLCETANNTGGLTGVVSFVEHGLMS